MPIFTTQLGTVEALAPQEAVKKIANYIRSLQETLEYRLSTLDSSNISEVDAALTDILIEGEDIAKVVGSLDSSYAELEIAAEGIAVEVARVSDDLEKNYATIEMTDSSIELAVAESRIYTDGKVSTLGTTVMVEIDGVKTEISGVDGRTTTLEETIEGLTVTTDTGVTKIKGGSIETETLYVKSANITGELVASSLKGSEVNITDPSGSLIGYFSTVNTSGGVSLSLLGANQLYCIALGGNATLMGGSGAAIVCGGSNSNPIVSCTGTFYAENYEAKFLELETRIATLERIFG